MIKINSYSDCEFPVLEQMAGIKVVKHDKRFHLNHFYVDDYFIIRTDGCRLVATLKPSDMQPGWYELIKKTKSEVMFEKVESDNEFPAWENIFPIPNESKNIECNGHGNSGFICNIIRETGAIFNIEWLLGFMPNQDNNPWETAYFKDAQSILTLATDNSLAAIMPMRS
jgi:hypothetical protein